jgi:hypothetical protein
MHTICGINQDLFKQKPTPAELAQLIAHWRCDDQAEFLICLGESLRDRCGGDITRQWQWIANELVKREDDPLGGTGTDFLKEIVHRLLLIRSEAA